ncbi:hypothetical protein C8Q80DRAFT_141283 [Daedaleopsis nitida]|nr:hypothetical protein C8Q80DRAFT_141283 [Daedaleopsis nitida]
MSQLLPWAAFSALRAYSLSSRSRTWAALVFALSVVPLGVNLAQFFYGGTGGVNDPIYGCVATSTITINAYARYMLLSWSQTLHC